MKKAIGIYIRTSELGMTEVEQRQLIRCAYTLNEGPIREWIDDQGGFQRAQLEELLDQIQTSSLSALVVARLDRLDMALSSEPEFLGFLRKLAENGVRFVSIADGLDSADPAGTFFKNLGPSLRAAREVVRAERIRLSLKKSKEEGHQLGRPRAVDYDYIVELRRQGLSTQAIADQLGVSRGAVQHCLRKAEPPGQSPD